MEQLIVGEIKQLTNSLNEFNQSLDITKRLEQMYQQGRYDFKMDLLEQVRSRICAIEISPVDDDYIKGVLGTYKIIENLLQEMK